MPKRKFDHFYHSAFSSFPIVFVYTFPTDVDEMEMEYKTGTGSYYEEDMSEGYEEIRQDEKDIDDDVDGELSLASHGTPTYDSGFPNGAEKGTDSREQSESSLEVERFMSTEEMKRYSPIPSFTSNAKRISNI